MSYLFFSNLYNNGVVKLSIFNSALLAQLEVDLKQAPSALRKNIGILGYRGSGEFEERARGTCVQNLA